ncbi:MAG: peptidoglycan-binding protein [Sandaracinaceae bacterium]
MSNLLKNGSRGDSVKALQEKLNALGFQIKPDGIFGPATDKTVRELQTLFGYTVDGIVGDGTTRLIDAQIGYKWNVQAPDAAEKALRAQGKTAEADALKAVREAKGGAAAPAKAEAAPAKGAPNKGTPNKGAPHKG